MEKWLCVVDNENTFSECLKHGSWGVRGNSIKTLKKVGIGDKLLFYVKNKKLGGIFTVTKTYRRDESVKDKLYPDCIKFDTKGISKELVDISKINFKEIFGKELSGFVRNPMHKLSEIDFEKLEEMLKQ